MGYGAGATLKPIVSFLLSDFDFFLSDVGILSPKVKIRHDILAVWANFDPFGPRIEKEGLTERAIILCKLFVFN
mgnify:CR=1 FL=1